jgi:two-component system response regulator YesN
MIRLLIVDDEPLVREGICNLIRSKENDYEIVADCYSGEEALKVVQNTKVDIIITDIKMTKMSGIKLIEETKKIAPAIGFVILSAFSDFEFVRNSFQLGVQDYIIKTEISYERITSVLDKIKEKIISREADYFKEIIKDTLLKKLIGGNHDKETLEELKQYQFEPSLNSLKIMFVRINDFENYIQNEFDFDEVLVIYGIKNIMLEILKETKLLIWHCYYL